jgi:uncharacterized caspase-like protein
MRQFVLPFLSVVAAGFAPQPSHAEIRALLIGVGDYQYLDADLKGPGFDVALIAETMVARGAKPALITALTTMPDAPGLPVGLTLGTPTRAEIVAVMTHLEATAQPGDTVVFYFSGHGSQAPDASGDEQGGPDEILLPSDAAGWKGAVAAVENALLDDELNDWAARLTARGVKLVGLIDACHSGTGFRAVGGSGTARVLDAEMLGIPDDAPNAVGQPTAPLTGEFAFLYSSQSDQRSFEFPLGEGADQRWHGAFTLALAQVLRGAPGASWRQVLSATRDRMTQGSVRQEPDGEGTMLDQMVFGDGAATARFAVTAGKLQAGLLQGLTEGSLVALYADAAGGAPLGQVALAQLTASKADLRADTLPKTAAWAELTTPAAPPALRLAPAQRLDDGDYHEHLAALSAVIADGIAVIDAASPDLIPLLTGGTLALAGADGMLDPLGPMSSPRVTMRDGETVTEASFRLLENAAHSTRIRAVLAGLGGRGLGIGGPPIDVAIERRSAAPDCKRGNASSPHDPAKGVTDCDELWLTLTNRSGRLQDVTVLYQAQDFTLTPIFPTQNLSNRLALGESIRIGLRIENPDNTDAAEEILIAALSPEVNERRADLSALATPERLRDTGAAGGAGALFGTVAALMDLDAGTATRAFALKRPALSLLRQSVRLTPRSPE